MNCIYCKRELVWQDDFEDVDIYGEMYIVSVYDCENAECNTTVEITHKINKVNVKNI